MPKPLMMEEVLRDYPKCPHCGVTKPQLQRRWMQFIILPDRPYGHNWATFACTSCASVMLVKSSLGNQSTLTVLQVFPAVQDVPEDLPEKAANYLKQAMAAVHAPDGAVMLAGSAVDAMLKAKKLTDGSVYARIDEAVKQGILTGDMGEWAHSVRLGANRPRHADDHDPHTSEEEARQAIDFVFTLGRVLFTLPAAIERGKVASAGPTSAS